MNSTGESFRCRLCRLSLCDKEELFLSIRLIFTCRKPTLPVSFPAAWVFSAIVYFLFCNCLWVFCGRISTVDTPYLNGARFPHIEQQQSALYFRQLCQGFQMSLLMSVPFQVTNQAMRHSSRPAYRTDSIRF